MNQLVALQYKPPEITNPANMLFQVAQARQMQQAADAGQMKIDESRRAAAETQLLNQLMQESVDPTTGQVSKSLLFRKMAERGIGTGIGEIQKNDAEIATKEATTTKSAVEAIGKRIEQSRELLGTITSPDQYVQWLANDFQDPVLGPWLKARGITPEKALASVEQALSTPGGFEQLLQRSALGLEKTLEQVYTNVNLGDRQQIVATPKYGQGQPRTVYDQKKGMPPEGAARIEIATDRLALDATKEANKVAGKAKPDNAVKTEEFETILSEMRSAYDSLDRMKAIPNNQRGTAANVQASIGASNIGQIASRAVGTEAQTERDFIASSRIRLLNAIKQATGMSAQQLNSNVELQTWLKAVTDPSQSKQAVDRILNSIEKFVKSNATKSAAQAPVKAPPAGYDLDK